MFDVRHVSMLQARYRHQVGRENSDEAYVVALCNLVLNEIGLRQHRFDWLRGDPSTTGRRATLPVDGYWPNAKVVVEYREAQHSRPVPHFDKPDRLTISGVHRGLQRGIYDRRREELIPLHGLRLVIITPDDLASNGCGKLYRRHSEDLEAVKRLLD